MEQTKEQNVETGLMMDSTNDFSETDAVYSDRMSAGASMPLRGDAPDAYVVRPPGIDLLSSQFTMSAILLVVFLILAFNAYYLRKKQKANGDIAQSIIWVNAAVAIFVILLSAYLYYAFRLEVNWHQTMIAT
jgi:hypothetical protein